MLNIHNHTCTITQCNGIANGMECIQIQKPDICTHHILKEHFAFMEQNQTNCYLYTLDTMNKIFKIVMYTKCHPKTWCILNYSTTGSVPGK